MSNSVIALDTLSFPLHGARLIEASAGTGKTFTIAGLYLRLLLGHGSADSKHQKPLTVDQILVVTFTEAATAELRDRIRARIHAGRLAFSRGQSDDPVIQPLLTEVTDHSLAASRLLAAERQMDEAAIYTIHGFCQRMLTQNAFESGSRFSNEFITNENHIKAQVVADYWRKTFYSLPPDLAKIVHNTWKHPKELFKAIGSYLTGPSVNLTEPAPSQDITELYHRDMARISSVKQAWRDHCGDFHDLISNSKVDKRSYSTRHLPNWLNLIEQWTAKDTLDYNIPDALFKFSQSALAEKTKSGEVPSHPVFETIERFSQEIPNLKTPLLADAISHCRQLLVDSKNTQQLLSFDDLLSNLSIAIDNDQSDILMARIRALYPVAMVDEFQDTDPLQYSIFSQIYLQHSACGLFMIGDPKQAIYGFRGADIFTYIKARNEVKSHFTLGTNWRSSADMIAAVNQLFNTPDSAFLYDKDIPFIAVDHSPKADLKTWYLNGEAQPALTYWHDDNEGELVPKKDYQLNMAQATASQINQLLSAANNGNAWLANKDQKQNIQAGNIAVLVRTAVEARAIKRALLKQGIASVYLSNRDSVFSSVIAADLQRLLHAVLSSNNERAMRASIGSDLFGFTAQQLDQLNNDENAWEAEVNHFKDYRTLWHKRGILPMLRHVMAQRAIAERLLEDDDGEATLTNLMHLGELLQQASLEIDSPHGVLRWLSESIEDVENGLGGADDAIARLESERNLVQIITIHKSKGLEYDLVFLPFAMTYRAASVGKYYDETNEHTVVDLSGCKNALALAEKERLAEDLRLLYVALTRAVYGCFIGTAALKEGQKKQSLSSAHLCALGHLLQNGDAGDADALLTGITQHKASLTCVAIAPLPEQPDTPLAAPLNSEQTLIANQLTTKIDSQWRMTSYSGIIKQDSSHQSHNSFNDILALDIDSSDEPRNSRDDTDPNNTDSSQTEDTLNPEHTAFSFPRGARPGTFLHTVFEEIDFAQPARSADNTKIIEKLMEQEHYDEVWLDIIQTMVDTVLNTPLDQQQLILSNTAPSQRLVEMEFLLPINVLTAPALNNVAHAHDSLSAQAGDLGFDNVSGMLKGFIDLIFEYQGKYYVLDWKSNHLGDDVSCYHGDALREAMADHRYDLQYQIYALALHRFLASRLANYNYHEHFGGVYYLFLRGMDGSSDNGIFHTQPSEAFLHALDALIDSTIPTDAEELQA